MATAECFLQLWALVLCQAGLRLKEIESEVESWKLEMKPEIESLQEIVMMRLILVQAG